MSSFPLPDVALQRADDFPAASQLPLVLDVDDALLRTDMLHETAVAYVKASPLRVFNLVVWLVKGKATLKRRLSESVPLDVDNLPVNDDLVEFARQAHAEGRQVGLATAADELLTLVVNGVRHPEWPGLVTAQ
jgi:hypothetical protein